MPLENFMRFAPRVDAHILAERADRCDWRCNLDGAVPDKANHLMGNAQSASRRVSERSSLLRRARHRCLYDLRAFA